MKQLERLLIQQGHRCFFCEQAIPEGEASVEHLSALSNGGPKDDSNCVACCRSLNTALSDLTVKEKLRVVLLQRAPFSCPARTVGPIAVAGAQGLPAESTLLAQVIENLKKYGGKRPTRLATLRNALAGSFPRSSEEELMAVLEAMKAQGFVVVTGLKVRYPRFDVAI